MIKRVMKHLGLLKPVKVITPFTNSYGHQIIGAHLPQVRIWSPVAKDAIAAHIVNTSNIGLGK